MDNKWIIFYYLWILAFNELADGKIIKYIALYCLYGDNYG